MKIAIAGTGYVGLSLAVPLAARNTVVALDIDASKVERLNRRLSSIEDPHIQRYLTEEPLDFRATVDPRDAFEGAQYVVIATPTDYDPSTNGFNTASVESVIAQVMAI